MATYFFDFRDGDYLTSDCEGHALPSAKVARQEVLDALFEIYLNEPRDSYRRQVRCSVRDERGTVVYRGSLTFEGVSLSTTLALTHPDGSSSAWP